MVGSGVSLGYGVSVGGGVLLGSGVGLGNGVSVGGDAVGVEGIGFVAMQAVGNRSNTASRQYELNDFLFMRRVPFY
jgi:hypothetical protein